ncbi:type IV pilus biogenesis protein PilM [Pseudalkalibacillus sp. R45]|uniref:type IV pilus biogenesis protein PilM n=1 Tax=Pseudalkalibacillus sp. R45 TaxID=3457433 RepID=UPI003FCE1D42
MAWLPIKKKYPIFLVFQDDCIRYVKLKSRSPLVVQKVGEKIIPSGVIQEGKIMNPKLLTQLLNKCVQEWKIKGKKVRIAIPDSISVIRKVPVPAIIPDDELKGYIQVELGASIHIPFEEPIFDVHKLQKKEEKIEYLLFAAPEDVMKEYVSVMEEVKLKPVGVELASLASYRLFYELDLVDDHHHYLCLHLERMGINATAFHRHVPLFTRYIPMLSPEAADEAFNDRMITQPFDIEERWNELVTEIDRVMSFYQFSLSEGSNTFDAFIISGDHPQGEQFSKQSTSYFDLPLIEVPEGKVVLERGLQVPKMFHTTVGLGLKGE